MNRNWKKHASYPPDPGKIDAPRKDASGSRNGTQDNDKVVGKGGSIMRSGLGFVILGVVVFGLTDAILAQPAPTAIAEINTLATEKSPFLSFDGLTLYFSRQESGVLPFTRIFQAQRPFPVGAFTSIQEVAGLAYVNGHVDYPWVSADNLRMYYYRTESGGVRRLLLTERANPLEAWQAGTYITELNALGSVLCPTLTQDERIIVFSGLNLPGGMGGADLWMAERTAVLNPFGTASSLDALNSSANEYHPALSADGLTLFFASDRSGSYKLYKSTRQAKFLPFPAPQEHVILDMNQAQIAFPALGDENGVLTLFLGSNVSGNWDLYRQSLEVNEPNLPAGTYYVDTVGGNDFNHGRTRDRAFETIQRAINAAVNGDTVLVLDGIYLGSGNTNLDFQGRRLVLKSENGPEAAIIDCQNSGRALYFHMNEGPEVLVEGFTIRNGNDFVCGGIYCTGGGGPTIRNCYLLNNQGAQAGAVYGHNGNAVVIENCVIRGNTGSGGAVRFDNSAGSLRFCVLADNTTTSNGGAILCNGGNTQPLIENCTVVNNQAGQYGGGLAATYSVQPKLKNSIFWGNTAGIAGNQLAVISALMQVDYCDVQGGQTDIIQQGGVAIWGNGNIDVDPLLRDPEGLGVFLASERGRYSPEHDLWVLDQETSPCIDAGGPLDDATDEPAPNGGQINMGAYGASIWASLSLAEEACSSLDYNGDGVMEFKDLYDMIDAWLNEWATAMAMEPSPS